MKHPLAGLARHPRLHLALARRSWDEGEELRLQLEAALELGPETVTAVSTASPETAFGLTQLLVSLVVPGRVVRLPMETVEWSERTAVHRTWQELPPPGVPGPNLELFGLAAELLRLAHQPAGPEPALEWAHELGDLLGFFHAAHPRPPARWVPRNRWEALPGVALVTGAKGFLGGHLSELLRGQGLTVHGVGRAELADRESTQRLLERVRPSRVYHLGAQSSVAAGLEARRETLLGNVMSQRYLLEGLVGTGARALVVGSAEEYGVPAALPLTEDMELQPRSLYAVSKVGQDLMGLQFWREHGLPVIRVRSFNHTGPGRSDRFMEASFARQIARIENEPQAEPVLRVGNLEARRDFTDGRDAVRAYALLLERGEPGEVYNVCSGRAWSAREVLDHLLQGTCVTIRVEVDPDRLRPADIPESRGSYARLEEATGWQPEIRLERSLLELLEWWRKQAPSARA